MNSLNSVNVLSGNLYIGKAKIAIAISRFNDFLTTSLLAGACDTLVRTGGVSAEDIDVFYVPGAFELPLLVDKLAAKDKYDGIVVLGAVIRGGTPHFDFLCSKVSNDIGTIGLNRSMPISFGVLTVDSIEQAIERSGTKAGNKGNEAALATLEMIDLMRKIG
ncbi:MAG: 6,7-dimethyl-8-ribityllumazine synthase [Psittacicella sp.]